MIEKSLFHLYFHVSVFPTNKTELHAVFDIFDRDGNGGLDYKEFDDALRYDKPVSEAIQLVVSQ